MEWIRIGGSDIFAVESDCHDGKFPEEYDYGKLRLFSEIIL